MTIEIKVPVLPESVADATIAAWHKKLGEPVKQDENLVDIETDKVVLEVVAPADGSLSEILCQAGDTVLAQQVIANFVKGDAKPEQTVDTTAAPIDNSEQNNNENDDALSPSVRRLINENNLDISKITGTGKNNRILKEDVTAFLDKSSPDNTATEQPLLSNGDRTEKRVPMSRLRARIAERLIQAQQTAAILSTFNEINMQAAMECRSQYKDKFEKKYGVRLGFMSFFVKAAAFALQEFPSVNAAIDNNDVIYHGYQDIGIAVSSPRGLVVPILRNAENMSFADIESKIREYGQKAKEGKLTIEEMTGGTFTISNGGVFGSLMSTPILNPPQSAILGMHKIEDRPIVENGQIVIRPMMYVTLSYDHRIIDGAESVQFLVAIKNILEDPSRLVLEV